MNENDEVQEKAKASGCGAPLAEGQWWSFCGETDMGQSLPALCTVCGGKFKRKS